MSCLKVQKFHEDLEESLEIGRLSVDKENDSDRKACIVAVRLQLYCSIIGMCYPLRKKMWFNLIEFCSQQLQLNEGKFSANFQCKFKWHSKFQYSFS